MMRHLQRPLRAVAASFLVLFLGVSASGCSGIDGIEFNGAIFNAIGLAGKGSTEEPKVARRNALVLPPDRKALPTPGSGRAIATGSLPQGQQSWPQDPEDVKVAKAAQEKKNIDKYCLEADWWQRKNPAEYNRMTKNGDLCQSALSKYFGKQTR